ncbi:CRISPR-associated endonuclease Cas1 [Haloplanus sp. GCM10025708]|uniref:CRISPR-associated endonuclease Cas1 n=1 Tax=Haloferacaceae TaxID=1644056 RepID=UPI00360CBC19
MLRDPFELTNRRYNPPTNEAKAIISFLNGTTYTTCVSAIRKTALDPTVGFAHEPGERGFTASYLTILSVSITYVVARVCLPYFEHSVTLR